jgi:NADH-quinone oxidoreductase subunit L
VTFVTYAIGMLALSGFPLLFSGFWSKDEILHAAHGWGGSRWPFYLGLLGAGCTAFYMTRQVCYVFFGASRLPSASAPPHESPWVMTLPLVILALGAIFLGFVGTPAWPWFQSFLDRQPLALEPARLFERQALLLMLASAVVACLGLGLGAWLYGRRPMASAELPDVLQRRWPDIFGLLRHKYFVDEIYDWAVVGLNARWARACDWLDRWVWSGGVALVAYAWLGLSWLNKFLDEFVVNSSFDSICRRAAGGGAGLSRLQNGLVQRYLRVIGLGLVVLVLLLLWGCHRS